MTSVTDRVCTCQPCEAFKIDLQAFRRQLDAREMAQRMLDYVARANGSSALSGLDVHEELVSLYHTPAERAIYVQGVADAKRKHKQLKQMGQVDQPVCSDLLQLCSHFRLEEADVEADAERESASLLRTRADAVETARQWLLVSARRMEADILSARRGNGLPTLVAEQYAQLLAEVGGEPLSRSTDAVASQIAGASAARQSAGQGRRHERDADDLILRPGRPDPPCFKSAHAHTPGGIFASVVLVQDVGYSGLGVLMQPSWSFQGQGSLDIHEHIRCVHTGTGT